jgi:hypothetical protein
LVGHGHDTICLPPPDLDAVLHAIDRDKSVGTLPININGRAGADTGRSLDDKVRPATTAAATVDGFKAIRVPITVTTFPAVITAATTATAAGGAVPATSGAPVLAERKNSPDPPLGAVSSVRTPGAVPTGCAVVFWGTTTMTAISAVAPARHGAISSAACAAAAARDDKRICTPPHAAGRPARTTVAASTTLAAVAAFPAESDANPRLISVRAFADIDSEYVIRVDVYDARHPPAATGRARFCGPGISSEPAGAPSSADIQSPVPRDPQRQRIGLFAGFISSREWQFRFGLWHDLLHVRPM